MSSLQIESLGMSKDIVTDNLDSGTTTDVDNINDLLEKRDTEALITELKKEHAELETLHKKLSADNLQLAEDKHMLAKKDGEITNLVRSLEEKNAALEAAHEELRKDNEQLETDKTALLNKDTQIKELEKKMHRNQVRLFIAIVIMCILGGLFTVFAIYDAKDTEADDEGNLKSKATGNNVQTTCGNIGGERFKTRKRAPSRDRFRQLVAQPRRLSDAGYVDAEAGRFSVLHDTTSDRPMSVSLNQEGMFGKNKLVDLLLASLITPGNVYVSMPFNGDTSATQRFVLGNYRNVPNGSGYKRIFDVGAGATFEVSCSSVDCESLVMKLVATAPSILASDQVTLTQGGDNYGATCMYSSCPDAYGMSTFR